MEEAAAIVRSAQCPWVIATDANMNPAEVRACNWAGLARGALVHTDMPTCSANTYDFFLVGGGLEKAVVGVQRLTDSGTFPHVGVRLLLRAGATRRRTRHIRKPPHIPAAFPSGPLTADVAAEMQKDEANSVHNDESEKPLDIDASSWVADARAHWGRLLGRKVGSDDRAKFVWQLTRSDTPRPYNDTTECAAAWRSIGRIASQTAAVVRNYHPKQQASVSSQAVWNMLNSVKEVAKQLQVQRGDAAITEGGKVIPNGEQEKEHFISYQEWVSQASNVVNLQLKSQTPQNIALSKLGAAALKNAQWFDSRARIERAKDFKLQLEGGATFHTGKGIPAQAAGSSLQDRSERKHVTKMSGRAAFRFVRGPNWVDALQERQ